MYSCGTISGRDSSTLKVLVRGHNFLPLGDGIKVAEDCLKISIFIAICEVKKKR